MKNLQVKRALGTLVMRRCVVRLHPVHATFEFSKMPCKFQSDPRLSAEVILQPTDVFPAVRPPTPRPLPPSAEWTIS